MDNADAELTRAELARPPLVLMYHSVARYDTDPFQVTVSPHRFAAQMRWLHRLGIRSVSVRELFGAQNQTQGQPQDQPQSQVRPRDRGSGWPGMRVGLTFDDGYQDFVTEAVPVLARYGFTATVFVVAGRLGGYNTWDRPGPRKALMTAEQVRQVADAGLEVGSHGLWHVPLSNVGEATLREETMRSRAILEETSGVPVTGFCYPYGDHTPREVEAVRDAGYGYGCAVSRSPFSCRHALPRTYVGDQDRLPRLFAKWARHWLRGGVTSR